MIRPANNPVGTGKKIKVCEMKPLQVAIITDKDSSHRGEVVLRTSDPNHIEIMSVSRPGVGFCWSDNPSDAREVTLLGEGESFIIELSNS